MPKSNIVRVLIILAVLFIAIQVVPVDRSNPPEVAVFDAPAEVMTVVNTSCADCHSHRTRWPWYSRIAPASWLVAHDVEEAREHLNLSTWGELPPEKQAKLRDEMWEEVDEGEMPPSVYLLAHADARLNDTARQSIRRWATEPPPSPDTEVADVVGGDETVAE